MPRWLALLLALSIGMLGAVQARINGGLAERLGDGVVAALISFGSGLVLVAAIVVLSSSARRGFARIPHLVANSGLRWWQLVGGCGGALLVVGQAVAVPVMGVALFTVLVVAGQTSAGLLVDRAGLGPAGPTAVTTRRIAAAAVAVLAVFVAVSTRLGSASFALGAALLTLVAGGLTSAQQAVNGRVSAATGQPFAAALVNFLAGTTTLILICVVRLATSGRPTLRLPGAPWLYLGGVIGLVFIATAAILVASLGVLVFGLAAVSGQLLGALLLDLVAPAPGAQVGLPMVVGVALTGVAVLLARAPRQPVRAPAWEDAAS